MSMMRPHHKYDETHYHKTLPRYLDKLEGLLIQYKHICTKPKHTYTHTPLCVCLSLSLHQGSDFPWHQLAICADLVVEVLCEYENLGCCPWGKPAAWCPVIRSLSFDVSLLIVFVSIHECVR